MTSSKTIGILDRLSSRTEIRSILAMRRARLFDNGFRSEGRHMWWIYRSMTLSLMRSQKVAYAIDPKVTVRAPARLVQRVSPLGKGIGSARVLRWAQGQVSASGSPIIRERTVSPFPWHFTAGFSPVADTVSLLKIRQIRLRLFILTLISVMSNTKAKVGKY